jgi:guanylate kinase
MSKGKLLIFSAPSGAGKTSLARALMERFPRLAFSVSTTTRAPRPGERDGIDYHFVSKDKFEAMVAAGDFLEHAQVFDNYYGTSRSSVEAMRAAGKDVILDIDWQGARAIRTQLPDAVSVFILPPSRAELERRLRGRGQDPEEVIARRMRDATSEMRHYDEFDFVVINDEFEAALADLRAIIDGHPEKARKPAIDPASLLAD